MRNPGGVKTKYILRRGEKDSSLGGGKENGKGFWKG